MDLDWYFNLRNLRRVHTAINFQARFARERITLYKSRIAYNDTLGWRGLYNGYRSQVQLLRAEMEIDIAWTLVAQNEDEYNHQREIGGWRITWKDEPVRRHDEDGDIIMID